MLSTVTEARPCMSVKITKYYRVKIEKGGGDEDIYSPSLGAYVITEVGHRINTARLAPLEPFFVHATSSRWTTYLLSNNLVNMARQRKAHKKSRDGCAQCKERHIRVRDLDSVLISYL